MAMTNIDGSTSIIDRQSYTFAFDSDGIFKPDASDIVANLQSFPSTNLDARYLSGAGNTGLFSSSLQVTFTWNGGSGFTVNDVQQLMLAYMNSAVVGHFTFTGAQTGTGDQP